MFRYRDLIIFLPWFYKELLRNTPLLGRSKGGKTGKLNWLLLYHFCPDDLSCDFLLMNNE